MDKYLLHPFDKQLLDTEMEEYLKYQRKTNSGLRYYGATLRIFVNKINCTINPHLLEFLRHNRYIDTGYMDDFIKSIVIFHYHVGGMYYINKNLIEKLLALNKKELVNWIAERSTFKVTRYSDINLLSKFKLVSVFLCFDKPGLGEEVLEEFCSLDLSYLENLKALLYGECCQILYDGILNNSSISKLKRLSLDFNYADLDADPIIDKLPDLKYVELIDVSDEKVKPREGIEIVYEDVECGGTSTDYYYSELYIQV